jgi:hypothetical protein
MSKSSTTMKDTRKILGIVNWMIPKNSDHGMFYAHHLYIPETNEWHREAKIVGMKDISIPPKVVEYSRLKISQSKIATEHAKFLKEAMMRN